MRTALTCTGPNYPAQTVELTSLVRLAAAPRALLPMPAAGGARLRPGSAQVNPVVWVALQAIPQKLRLNKRSGWAVLLGILAAFCFGAVGPAGYSTARPPQEVRKL